MVNLQQLQRSKRSWDRNRENYSWNNWQHSLNIWFKMKWKGMSQSTESSSSRFFPGSESTWFPRAVSSSHPSEKVLESKGWFHNWSWKISHRIRQTHRNASSRRWLLIMLIKSRSLKTSSSWMIFGLGSWYSLETVSCLLWDPQHIWCQTIKTFNSAGVYLRGSSTEMVDSASWTSK